KAAGIRIEQPKSVPCASGTMPLATAAAEPPDEPAGLRAGFHGLRVAPNSSLTVFAPAANSGVLVLPRMMAPSLRSRATTSASSVGTKSLYRGDAKVVRMPAVGVISLMRTGRPSSRRGASPFCSRCSACLAAARAESSASVMMALICGLIRAIASRCAARTSAGLTWRSRTRRASLTAESFVRSSCAMSAATALRERMRSPAVSRDPEGRSVERLDVDRGAVDHWETGVPTIECQEEIRPTEQNRLRAPFNAELPTDGEYRSSLNVSGAAVERHLQIVLVNDVLGRSLRCHNLRRFDEAVKLAAHRRLRSKYADSLQPLPSYFGVDLRDGADE